MSEKTNTSGHTSAEHKSAEHKSVEHKPLELKSDAEVTPVRSRRTKPADNKFTELQEKLKIKAEEDGKMVRGFFRFYEVPGGSMKFSYRAYKNDPIKTYELEDGKLYTIPMGVAKHLNNDCWYPVHALRKNEDGSNSRYVGKRVQRCGFQSTDFIDTTIAERDFIIEPVKIVR